MLGSFKKLFGDKKNSLYIGAPVEGEAVSISDVNDLTFSTEILGKGVAIKPTKGRVVSPVDGTVSMVFDTGHAVSVMSDFGAEILVHVGLNTVELKGKYYNIHVSDGDRVKKGDLLLEFDLQKISEYGYDMITPIIICNSDNFKEINQKVGKTVKEGDFIFKIKK